MPARLLPDDLTEYILRCGGCKRRIVFKLGDTENGEWSPELVCPGCKFRHQLPGQHLWEVYTGN